MRSRGTQHSNTTGLSTIGLNTTGLRPGRTSARRRRAVAAMLAIAAFAWPALAAGRSPAGGAGQDGGAAVTVGGRELPLRAKATRSFLFVDVYSVGFYLPPSARGEQDALQAEVPKAVRVKVLYSGSMPSGVPSAWWEELVPALSDDQQQKLRDAFSRLSAGDEIWVSYVPGQGTTLRVNGRTILTDKGHALMNAVAGLWLGQSPVAAEVQQELRRQLG